MYRAICNSLGRDGISPATGCERAGGSGVWAWLAGARPLCRLCAWFPSSARILTLFFALLLSPLPCQALALESALPVRRTPLQGHSRQSCGIEMHSLPRSLLPASWPRTVSQRRLLLNNAMVLSITCRENGEKQTKTRFPWRIKTLITAHTSSLSLALRLLPSSLSLSLSHSLSHSAALTPSFHRHHWERQ